MALFGEIMSVLFLSSENFISEQDMLLLLSFAKTPDPFVYACPEGSWVASVAQHNSIVTLELPPSFWKQFFTLRLYLKRLGKQESVQIHVFDAKAYRLAKWLRRASKTPVIIVASFHEPLRLSQSPLFSHSKEDTKAKTENTPKRRVFSPLRPLDIDNTDILREFLAKKIKCLFVSSPELYRVLENQNIPYNSISLLTYAHNKHEPNFMSQAFEHFHSFEQNRTLSSACSMNLEKYDLKERFIFLIDTELEEESGIHILLQALAIIKEKHIKAARLNNDNLMQANLTPEHKTKDNKNDAKNQNALPRHIQVHICGTGSKFDDFVQEAKDLQIDDMLAFFGDFNAHLLYKNAHALICPATSGEGNFRCISKAFFESLPVISSDISPHTKIILTGKTQRCSLIFPRDNAETLATCMIHIMTDMPLREELIREGHEVLSKIDYSDLATMYQNVIKKI